jgi:hypothetical protein
MLPLCVPGVEKAKADGGEVEGRVALALANAKQLLTVVKAAHPDFDLRSHTLDNCKDAAGDVDELACMWGKCDTAYKAFEEGKGGADLALALLLKVWMGPCFPCCTRVHTSSS